MKDNRYVASIYRAEKKIIKKNKEKTLSIDSKKEKIHMRNKNFSIPLLNKIFKESIYKNKKGQIKNSYFSDKSKTMMKLPRLNSSLISYQKQLGSKGILMNYMVYEEFNKKIKNSLINTNIKTKDKQLKDSILANTFKNIKKERKISPLNPSDYNKIIFQHKCKNLRKSASEALIRRIIIIRPKAINKNINNKKVNSTKNKPIKINLNIQKIFSPLEINLPKYKENISSQKLINKKKENKTNKSIKFKKIIFNQK